MQHSTGNSSHYKIMHMSVHVHSKHGEACIALLIEGNDYQINGF